MKFLKILLCLLSLALISCAEIGLKPHKPSLKSIQEISKVSGIYRILSVKGNTPAVEKILNGDLMSCNTTTFSMPRGNTVGSFIREIYEEELRAANRLSLNGESIEVIVKSMTLESFDKENGVWKMDIDYIHNDKTTNVRSSIEFETKLGLVASCVNTSSVFEEALADNFVEFFKRNRN